MLHEGPTDGINDSTGAVEKKISINYSKAKTKFSLSLHYSGMSIKQRFGNLQPMITYLGMSFA